MALRLQNLALDAVERYKVGDLTACGITLDNQSVDHTCLWKKLLLKLFEGILEAYLKLFTLLFK